jgi:hypothetical protein
MRKQWQRHYITLTFREISLIFYQRPKLPKLDIQYNTELHSLLSNFSRYTGEASYSVGSIGYMDVDCDFIDFTYVCCTSQSLDRTIKREISSFSEQLRSNEGRLILLFSCG